MKKKCPDMGLCAVLLIWLSQAELGRVWAQEHKGKEITFMPKKKQINLRVNPE